LVTGLVFFSLFPNNLFPTGNRSHIHSFIRLIHPTCLDIPCAIHSTAATPGSHTPGSLHCNLNNTACCLPKLFKRAPLRRRKNLQHLVPFLHQTTTTTKI
jgi:hypothetical protein